MARSNVTDFLKYFSENNKLFWPAVERNYSHNDQLFSELGSILIAWAEKYIGADYLKVLTEGYAKFVIDVNKSQMKYEVTGEYKNKSYQQVYNDFYDNSDVMKYYHWGVYVTTFAWQHHLHIYKFYKDYFISRLNKNTGSLLDLGSGSGVWSMLLSHHVPAWRVRGIDISKTSVELANKICAVNGLSHSASYSLNDALTFTSDDSCDAAISCFLMEHLETPEKLLANIFNNLKPRAYAFITAALTAAETDHIKEFIRESEIVLLAEQAGFRVIASFSGAPEDFIADSRFLPRSMALVLQKRKNAIY